MVDGTQLTRVEVPGGSSEALGVNDGGLLDKDPRLLAADVDRRAKAGRPGTR